MVADSKKMLFSTDDRVSPTDSVSTWEGEGEWATQTPWASKSEDESDTEPLDEEPCQEEYYAFLREMAGSFEATSEDDESEPDSEDEAGDEDGEENQPGTFQGEVKPNSRGKLAFAHSPASGPPALGGPSPAHGSDGGKGHKGDRFTVGSKECNSLSKRFPKGDPLTTGSENPERDNLEPRDQGKSSVQGLWTALGDIKGLCDVGGSRTRPTACRADGSSSSSTTAMSASDSLPLSDASQGETRDEEDPEPDSDNGCPLVPLPNYDNRAPVEDDYDVVQAVADFAAQRSGDALQLQKENLLYDLRMKGAQAERLRGPASNPHPDARNRAHYAFVRSEILKETAALHVQLAALGGPSTGIQASGGTDGVDFASATGGPRC